MFCKESVLRNFTKFTGKHLRQSLFFNKVAGLRSATLLKKRVFSCEFLRNFWEYLFLRNTYGGCFWKLLVHSQIKYCFARNYPNKNQYLIMCWRSCFLNNSASKELFCVDCCHFGNILGTKTLIKETYDGSRKSEINMTQICINLQLYQITDSGAGVFLWILGVF